MIEQMEKPFPTTLQLLRNLALRVGHGQHGLCGSGGRHHQDCSFGATSHTPRKLDDIYYMKGDDYDVNRIKRKGF